MKKKDVFPVRPVNKGLIVREGKLPEVPETTEGGIVLPPSKATPRMMFAASEVVAVSPGCKTLDDVVLKAGMVVFHLPGSGNAWWVPGQGQFRRLAVTDIHGIKVAE